MGPTPRRRLRIPGEAIRLSNPLVTVILPVHGRAPMLLQALDSVRRQTYENWDMVVVADACDPPTLQVLAEARDAEPRIQVDASKSARGLAKALNAALRLATGRLVARLDADDVCHPRRLERQVRFLERHPEVGIVGAACVALRDGRRRLMDYPETDLGVRWTLLRGSAFAHPAVMIRRDVLGGLDGPYRDRPASEDYDLWVRRG